MINKETKYFGTAILVNGLQLLLCFIIYLVSLIVGVNNVIIAGVMLIAEMLIWLVCGFKLAVSGKMNKFWNLFIGAFIAILPILVYTLIAYGVSKLTPIDSQGWTEFFFLGGPIIFYNKPITLLMSIFRGHGYLLFAANYVIIAVCYFIGEFFGFVINGGKRMMNNKKTGKVAKKEKPKKIKEKKLSRKEKKQLKKQQKKKQDESVKDEQDDNLETEEKNGNPADEEIQYVDKEDENRSIEELKVSNIDKDSEEVEVKYKEEKQEILNASVDELTPEIEEKEDRLAEEIVNNILKENLKEQREKQNNNEDE